MNEVADLGARQQQLHRIRRCAHDPRIAALVLRLEGSPGGWAAMHDLREAVLTVRGAGKPVVRPARVARQRPHLARQRV